MTASWLSVTIVAIAFTADGLAQVDPSKSDPGLTSAYNGNGVQIALYKKDGDKFSKVATAELDGMLRFTTEGIVSGQEGLKRLRFGPDDASWIKITSCKLENGRAIVTTEEKKSFEIFNLGIGAFAGQIEPLVQSQPEAQTATPIQVGNYTGNTEGIPDFHLTLVKADESVKVSELGYDFAGYASVGQASLEGKQAFGKTLGNKLTFQFRVLTSFGVPNLNAPKVSVGTGVYQAEIAANQDGTLACVLTQIENIDAPYSDINLSNINFHMGDEKPELKKEYTLVLKTSKNTEASSKPKK